MDKWEGLVAVVTGASSGIGRAIALKLAENGMKVAALARREDKLNDLVGKFRGSGGSIKAYKCDVTKDTEIEQTFNKIGKDMGRIRVLVNNAGISYNTNMLDFELEKWRQMFDVNVFGMFYCIKQIVNSVKQSNDKSLVHIFNINSIAGHYVPLDTVIFPYAATKHSVTLLTRGMLKQLGAEDLSHIKLTSVSPGVVDTEIFDVGGWTSMDMSKVSHLAPDDVAQALISSLSSPPNVVISEITVKPAGEVF